MTTDYSAVAGSAVLGTPGLRVCLLVSADGLPLGASPATDERRASAVWARLCSLGRVMRGFVTVDDELWAFNQNDQHGVLVIADPALRPAVALEVADQVLAAVRPVGGLGAQADAAPEAREAREGRDMRDLRPLGRRLRSALHPEGKGAPSGSEPTPVPAVVALEPVEPSAETSAEATAGASVEVAQDETPTAAAEPVDAETGAGVSSEGDLPVEVKGDVDVVALAREFSGLLFDREDGLR